MKSLGRLAVAGVVILALTTVAFFSARSESVTDPRPTNVLPSGLAGLAELLQADGFDVTVEVSDSPSVPSDRLVVACLVVGEGFLGLGRPAEDKSEAAVRAHLDKGGNVLALLYEPDFVVASSKVGTAQVKESDVQLSVGSLLELPYSFDAEGPWRSVMTVESGDLVTAHAVGRGTLVTVANAIGSTNRYLKRDDNAGVYLELFRRANGERRKVSFFLATLGMGQSPGLAGTIGPWAAALQWQLFALLAVMAWTVSRRFGLPEEDEPFQRGARQLSDSLAEVLRTGKKRAFASQIIADQALRATRVKLRLPPSSSVEDILRRSDRETKEAYGALLTASEERRPGPTIDALRRFLAKLGHR